MYIYHRNIFENVNYAKKYLALNNIKVDNKDYVKLKEILKKNLGFLGDWTKFMFNNNIKVEELEYLYNDYFKNSEYKFLFKDLNINDFTSTEDVIDYLMKRKQNKQVQQVIKSLPSRTRKIVNEKLKSLIFNNLEYYNEIKDFYSKKGGRYKDIKDLIVDTRSFIENLKGPWNSDEISKKLLPEEVIYKDDHTLIAWIQTYERSCAIGSKSWCISTDKVQWNFYTEYFNKQYFIWDFTKDIGDKRSMIGVTVKPNGDILVVHFKDDSKGDIKDVQKYLKWLKPYNKKYIENNADLKDLLTLAILGFTEKFIEQVEKNSKSFRDRVATAKKLKNNSIFTKACEYGNFEIVKYLVENHNFIEVRGLNMAILNNKEDVVFYLLNYIEPNTYSLSLAIINNNLNIIDYLLENFDLNLNKKDILEVTVKYNRINLLKRFLKDPKIDPSIRNNSLLKMARIKNRKEIEEYLLTLPKVREKI